MEKMTQQDEQALLGAVKESARLIADGESPESAIAKVASDRNIAREHVKRVVEAFNVNATLSHFKNASGEERAGEFPTASVDGVFKAMYPEDQQTPVQKAASTWSPGPDAYVEYGDYMQLEFPDFGPQAVVGSNLPKSSAIDAIASDFRKEARAVEDLKSELGQRGENLVSTLDKLASYFTPVDAPALTDLPADIVPVIEERVLPLRQAGVSSRGDWGPALKQAQQAKQAYLETAQAVTKSSERLDELDRVTSERLEAVKEGKGNFLTGVVGGLTSEVISPGAASTSKAAPNVADFADPETTAEIKGIQAQSMLRTMMDEDPVLRSADTTSVLRAFNEISDLAPTVATQPMLARGWLRKVVETEGLEPFDIQQLVKAERDLRGMSLEKDVVTRG